MWNNQLCDGNEHLRMKHSGILVLAGKSVFFFFFLDTGWFSLLELVWFFLSKQGSCHCGSCDPWALRTHPTCMQRGLQPETPYRNNPVRRWRQRSFSGRVSIGWLAVSLRSAFSLPLTSPQLSPDFHMVSKDLNSGPHARVVGTSPTEPSPQGPSAFLLNSRQSSVSGSGFLSTKHPSQGRQWEREVELDFTVPVPYLVNVFLLWWSVPISLGSLVLLPAWRAPSILEWR